jgi:hypothetical protein
LKISRALAPATLARSQIFPQPSEFPGSGFLKHAETLRHMIEGFTGCGKTQDFEGYGL